MTMSTSPLTMPTEVIILIISALDANEAHFSETLASLSLVSSQFRPIAQFRLFQRYTVRFQRTRAPDAFEQGILNTLKTNSLASSAFQDLRLVDARISDPEGECFTEMKQTVNLLKALSSQPISIISVSSEKAGQRWAYHPPILKRMASFDSLRCVRLYNVSSISDKIVRLVLLPSLEELELVKVEIRFQIATPPAGPTKLKRLTLRHISTNHSSDPYRDHFPHAAKILFEKPRISLRGLERYDTNTEASCEDGMAAIAEACSKRIDTLSYQLSGWKLFDEAITPWAYYTEQQIGLFDAFDSVHTLELVLLWNPNIDIPAYHLFKEAYLFVPPRDVKQLSIVFPGQYAGDTAQDRLDVWFKEVAESFDTSIDANFPDRWDTLCRIDFRLRFCQGTEANPQRMRLRFDKAFMPLVARRGVEVSVHPYDFSSFPFVSKV